MELNTLWRKKIFSVFSAYFRGRRARVEGLSKVERANNRAIQKQSFVRSRQALGNLPIEL